MDAPRRKGSATAAKDQKLAAPVSGWEAAMSECIHVSGKLEGEDAALGAMRNDRSILYLATVCECVHGPRSEWPRGVFSLVLLRAAINQARKLLHLNSHDDTISKHT